MDNPLTKKKYRENSKKWLMQYKYSHSCEICGYREHSEILQFHHMELVRNKGIIRHQSQGMTGGRSTVKWMKEEIKKCILLCPNCHLWLHYSHNKFDYRAKD